MPLRLSGALDTSVQRFTRSRADKGRWLPYTHGSCCDDTPQWVSEHEQREGLQARGGIWVEDLCIVEWSKCTTLN